MFSSSEKEPDRSTGGKNDSGSSRLPSLSTNVCPSSPDRQGDSQHLTQENVNDFLNEHGLLENGVYTAVLGGLRQSFTVRGHGPLLIVPTPGWGADSSMYQNTLTPLEDGNTLLYLETRGSGRSESPAFVHEYHFSFIASDIDQLRQLLRQDQLRFFGHSGAGGIGLQYVLQYPGRVSELNLVCTTSAMDAEYHMEVNANFSSKISSYPEYDQALQQYQMLLQGDTDEHFRQAMLSVLPLYFDDPANAQLLSPTIESSDQSFNIATYRAFCAVNLFDFKPYLAYVDAKTRIFAGRGDAVCSTSQALTLHRGISGSSLHLFEDSGHFPWLEEGEKFFSFF
jgi:proline iminopeptidase